MRRGFTQLAELLRSTKHFSVNSATQAHTSTLFSFARTIRECNCRKPLPGLFEQAVAQFPEITAATSVMIGDSLSDIEFGRRLGMKTIFIEGDPRARKPSAEETAKLADLRCASLSEAVDALLAAH